MTDNTITQLQQLDSVEYIQSHIQKILEEYLNKTLTNFIEKPKEYQPKIFTVGEKKAYVHSFTRSSDLFKYLMNKTSLSEDGFMNLAYKTFFDKGMDNIVRAYQDHYDEAEIILQCNYSGGLGYL